MGIIVPVRDIDKVSPEVLKESYFLGNTGKLPPVGSGNLFEYKLHDMPSVDLTEIRRKYNSGDTNKNMPK